MNMKRNLQQIYSHFKQCAFDKSCKASAALVAFMACNPLMSFAADVTDAANKNAGITDWPWTRFLNSLMQQLTGPLPKVLGILGIAVAAIGMFMGNHGAGMQKMLVLIFAVSICLFAPSFISYISTGATGTDGSGLTIFAYMK